MKTLLYLVCLAALCNHNAQCQNKVKHLRQLAERNLRYLTSSKALLKRVQIDDEGIAIYPREYSKPEFNIYWDEIAQFVDIIEHQDFYSIQQVYRSKKSNRFVRNGIVADTQHYNGFPTSFENLAIALDPGHFGGDLEEARLEGRMVHVKGEDVGQSEDIKFFEADLTFQTALILKRKLEEKGARVMITRPQGAGALNKKFPAWLRTSFHEDLRRSWKLGDLQKSFYDTLVRAYTDTVKVSSRYYLFQFYKYLDFRARSKKINDFHPNITFVIHYNASESGRQYGKERYIKPIALNYSMAFVPGSFEYDELEKPDQKIDFVRLLLSSDLNNSLRLGDLLVRRHRELLGVPPIPFDSLHRMKEVVIRTPYDGVFSRNLYLTRSVRGIVVYGESLYQDNYWEAIELSKKDYTVSDPESQILYRTSSRCALVADAYYESLKEFLEQNKLSQSEHMTDTVELNRQ